MTQKDPTSRSTLPMGTHFGQMFLRKDFYCGAEIFALPSSEPLSFPRAQTLPPPRPPWARPLFASASEHSGGPPSSPLSPRQHAGEGARRAHGIRAGVAAPALLTLFGRMRRFGHPIRCHTRTLENPGQKLKRGGRANGASGLLILGGQPTVVTAVGNKYTTSRSRYRRCRGVARLVE